MRVSDGGVICMQEGCRGRPRSRIGQVASLSG